MNIADELKKLRDLHESGGLSDEEFAAAKAAVLANSNVEDKPPGQPVLEAHLAEIKRQNDIERLDREWQMERERYMVADRYGRRYIPNRGLSVLGGFVIVGFGILWTAFAASMGAPGFFPLFGVIFILAGIVVSIFSFSKASEHDQAYERYRRRRAQMLAAQNPKDRDS